MKQPLEGKKNPADSVLRSVHERNTQDRYLKNKGIKEIREDKASLALIQSIQGETESL